jgi:hypothetical protein
MDKLVVEGVSKCCLCWCLSLVGVGRLLKPAGVGAASVPARKLKCCSAQSTVHTAMYSGLTSWTA